jgi:hypothetical protein
MFFMSSYLKCNMLSRRLLFGSVSARVSVHILGFDQNFIHKFFDVCAVVNFDVCV